MAERTAAQGTLEAERARARDRVEAALDGWPSLVARADALAAQRRALGAALAAFEASQVLDQQRQRALDTALDAVRAAGFSDLAEARDALLDEELTEQLASVVERYGHALAEAEAELARPELASAAAAPPAELDVAQAAAATADDEHRTAFAAARRATQIADDITSRRAEIEARLAGLGPLVEEHEQLRRLADLANGDDRQVANRMRLSTYVLAARLEQVAAAASQRLRRMSGDRYTIVHTDETPDGRRKGGLGLRVVDAWTGTERETSTLSGGEAFFTSLALALGVADVVTAESGGVRLDTLFIDEGFGSLDDDTLHDVMDVLDGLRAGGRAIGVVSHVGDLRTRVGTRLEVVKSPAGSTIRAC